MQPLTDKVFGVTGAASGIGQATAHYLGRRGASLSLADISETELNNAAESIRRATRAEVLVCVTDVSKPEQVDEWISSTVSKFGRLDGAANLAGVFREFGDSGGIASMDDGLWDSILGINLTGLMYCLRAQLKVMSLGGSIVNASSVARITRISAVPRLLDEQARSYRPFEMRSTRSRQSRNQDQCHCAVSQELLHIFSSADQVAVVR